MLKSVTATLRAIVPVIDWVEEYRQRRGHLPRIPLKDYWRSLAEASSAVWWEEVETKAMDAAQVARECHDKAVMEEWARSPARREGEILDRMTAKGPAPQGDHETFMARFIGEADEG
jgi:hypothetical protein